MPKSPEGREASINLETSINHLAARPAYPHPDAAADVSLIRDERDLQRDPQLTGQRDGHEKIPETGGHANEPPSRVSFEHLPVDDQKVLSAVVRHRLLSFAQVHRLRFAERHASLTRRRLRALRDQGWLVFRDGVRTRGRGVRFALPTARTLAAVLPRLTCTTAQTPYGGLVTAMLPRKSTRPLAFPDSTSPKWLPHQIEVNHLLARIATSSRAIRWASSWDAPFASDAGIALPQPDYVLVEDVGNTMRVVFGEHDRGTEPIERFIARKIELYTDLAAFPEITGAWFGNIPFVVHVTVIDVPHQAPLRRLRALLEAAALSRHPDLFRFTLGGWLFAHPDEPVFFTTAHAPATDAMHWPVHVTAPG